jgi:predicted transcriptional regulator
MKCLYIGGIMNHNMVLAALPDSEEEAMSMKEIAFAMGLEISSYSNRTRTQRRLARSLRALIKWGWVSCERRQREVGHKFWYNAYWKTALARQTEEYVTAIGPVEV